jgi:hypothetical protein
MLEWLACLWMNFAMCMRHNKKSRPAAGRLCFMMIEKKKVCLLWL